MAPPDRFVQIRRQHRIQLAVFLSILIFLVYCLLTIDNLLMSFMVAVVISYLLSPIISHFEGSGISRLTSISFVYGLFTALAAVAVYSFSPLIGDQFVSLRESAPKYVEGTVRFIEQITAAFSVFNGDLINVNVSDQLRSSLTYYSSQIVQDIPTLLSSSASVLLLSPLLGFFILKDGRHFSREMLRLVPNNIFELVLNLQFQINQQVGHFIRARMIESLIVGLILLIGFWIIKVPYALLLAVFAALANLIPYVGPLIGAAPGLIVVAVNEGFGGSLLAIVIVYVFAQLIDMFFILPLVVARIVNLHPLSVILAVIIGAEFLGIVGMLISIPVAAALKVTFVNIYAHLTDHSG